MSIRDPRSGLEKNPYQSPSVNPKHSDKNSQLHGFSPATPTSTRPRPLICIGRAPLRPALGFLPSSAGPEAQTGLGAGPGRSTCPLRPHDGGGRGLSCGAPPRGAGAGVCGCGRLRGLPRFSTSPVGASRTRTPEPPRAGHPTRPRLASRSTGKAGPISERRLPSDSRPPDTLLTPRAPRSLIGCVCRRSGRRRRPAPARAPLGPRPCPRRPASFRPCRAPSVFRARPARPACLTPNGRPRAPISGRQGASPGLRRRIGGARGSGREAGLPRAAAEEQLASLQLASAVRAARR